MYEITYKDIMNKKALTLSNIHLTKSTKITQICYFLTFITSLF